MIQLQEKNFDIAMVMAPDDLRESDIDEEDVRALVAACTELDPRKSLRDVGVNRYSKLKYVTLKV